MDSLIARLRTLPQRHGRTTILLMVLILALGFGLRAQRVVEPLATPGDDSAAYYDLSKSLYTEGSYGSENFRDPSDWSPGAPIIYAAAYALTGGAREGTARIVELLFGLGSIVIVYLLGRRLNCRPAGLIAAFGVAVYPPFIHSTGALFSEPPAMFMLPAAVLAFLWATGPPPPLPGARPQRSKPTKNATGRGPGSPRRLLLPGLLFGLTAMIRPEYLLVGLAFAVLALVRVGHERGWHRGLAGALALGAAIFIPIVPWTIHNVVVLDRVVPISTGGGKALYVGTLLPADGEYQRAKALLVKRYLGLELEPGSAELDAINPTDLFDRIADRYPELPRDEALGKIGKQNFYDYLEEDPVAYAGMTVRKVWRMWSSGIGEAMSTSAGRVVQVILVALGLGGLGVLAARRRRWELVAMATPILLVTMVGAATLAAPRRNEVLMTLIFPLAGVTLAWASAAISSSPRWPFRRASSRPS